MKTKQYLTFSSIVGSILFMKLFLHIFLSKANIYRLNVSFFLNYILECSRVILKNKLDDVPEIIDEIEKIDRHF